MSARAAVMFQGYFSGGRENNPLRFKQGLLQIRRLSPQGYSSGRVYNPVPGQTFLPAVPVQNPGNLPAHPGKTGFSGNLAVRGYLPLRYASDDLNNPESKFRPLRHDQLLSRQTGQPRT